MAGYLRAELNRQLSFNMQTTLYQKINGFLGIAPFENPHLHDSKGVSFRYHNDRPWVLQDVNLFVPAQGCLALNKAKKVMSILLGPVSDRARWWNGIEL